MSKVVSLLKSAIVFGITCGLLSSCASTPEAAAPATETNQTATAENKPDAPKAAVDHHTKAVAVAFLKYSEDHDDMFAKFASSADLAKLLDKYLAKPEEKAAVGSVVWNQDISEFSATSADPGAVWLFHVRDADATGKIETIYIDTHTKLFTAEELADAKKKSSEITAPIAESIKKSKKG